MILDKGNFASEIVELPEIGKYIYVYKGKDSISFSLQELDNLIDLLYDINEITSKVTEINP